MKKLFFSVLVFCFITTTFASDGTEKLDVRLKMLMNTKSLSKLTNQQFYNVFIVGDAQSIKSDVESNGGFVNTIAGNILTAQIPHQSIISIAKSPSVREIKLATPVKIKNDKAIENINADKVHAGESPLNSSYKGKNVIVGIIDSGIDWDHEDFRNPDDNTKSRIISIWDQLDSVGTNPNSFSYGVEWTKEQIEDELDGIPANVVRHRDNDPSSGGHGTHVSGSAAGNLGIAPEADIIVVGLDFQNSTGIIDGANYIYQKAAELGRPCVINASVGSHFGTHDGSGAESQALDYLVNETYGRVFCAAAGNEGADYIHFGGINLNNQESWTYYVGYPDFETPEIVMYMYMIIDTDNMDNFQVAVALDSLVWNDEYGIDFSVQSDSTEWYSVNTILSDEPGEVLFYENGDTAGNVIMYASQISDTRTEMLVLITDLYDYDLDDYSISGWDAWRLHFKGTGKFHVWAEDVLNISYPQGNNLYSDANFNIADNDYSVGMPADAHDVISVGAYTNRNSWTDIDGVYQEMGEEVGSLADFSSHGPTLDNRIKPEIVAPGQYVNSSFSSDIEPDDLTMVTNNGKRIVMSGTSMATPITTGAVALLLEKNPTMTNKEVRTAIFDNADTDAFVNESGTLPNNLWGYGKLDIFEAITNISTTIDNKNIKINENFTLEQNYPNPFNPTTTIRYNIPKNAHVNINVHNMLGQKVKTLVNSDQKIGYRSVIWNGKNDAGELMPSGIYIYKMIINDQVKSHKMILMK